MVFRTSKIIYIESVILDVMKRFTRFWTQTTRRIAKLFRRIPKKYLVIAGLVLTAATIVTLSVLYGRGLIDFFSSQERIEQTIEAAGAWGPLVMIALQTLQVLIAPIPGQITGIAAGYLFGVFFGTIYAMIGMVIGFTLIFVFARKLGRPAVEYFVDKKTLKKFDYLADSNGVFAFFLILLLPFFPDDFVCYIAGLTAIPIRKLIIVAFLARLPGTFLFAVAGDNLANNNLETVIYLAVIVVAFGGVAWLQRNRIEQLVQRLSRNKKD